MNRIQLLVVSVALAGAGLAHGAESIYVSNPAPTMQKVSAALSTRDYKVDAARHIYASYAPRIYKGRLPPLIHAVVVVETTVDRNGQPRDIKVVRGPSHAPDVTQAVLEMIRRASPLPVPGSFAGDMRYTEIWLVHKDGRFQLDSLTEGQD